MAGEPIVMDWVALAGIAARVAGLARAGGVPDVVVGIARNGLVPAVIICHALGVRDLRSVHVTHTVADAVDAGKTPEPVHRNVASLGDLTGADVLIVDDIAGSGATLRDVAGLVQARRPTTVRTAACVVNRANWRVGSGDEVLVPAVSVVMSVAPIVYAGAQPVFVDCTGNASPRRSRPRPARAAAASGWQPRCRPPPAAGRAEAFTVPDGVACARERGTERSILR